jgi:hypothetical protein
MRLSRLAILILVCCTFTIGVYSQEDSCNLKVSLLTCGPGEDLYSVFGHSAIRVQDLSGHSDIIYNYGTFDFDDPDFYVKFVKGKLRYYVSPERFEDFMYSYKMENRSVVEQELSLNCEEKKKLYHALRINALEENKFYAYQFLFDNCSTRLRDIVKQNANDSAHVKRILPKNPPSFRNMIHYYLDQGGEKWSEFGIDLLLGSRIDRKVENEEAMFLPDYLMKGFDSATIRNSSLTKNKKTLLPQTAVQSNGIAITPLVVSIILLVIGVALMLVKAPWIQKAADVFDFVLFFVLGLMGCLILFMWFGTDHELCRDNYNLFWALPTNIIFAFTVFKKRPIVKKYFRIPAIISTVFVVSWMFLPQGMNTAFLPLILLSGIRSANRVIKM